VPFNQGFGPLKKRIVQLVSFLASNLQDVLKAGGRNESSLRNIQTYLSQEQIGANGRGMNEHADFSLACLHQVFKGTNHPLTGVTRRRGNLTEESPPIVLVVRYQVGKSAADINPYSILRFHIKFTSYICFVDVPSLHAIPLRLPGVKTGHCRKLLSL
jgi:hypothetical protein